MEARLEEEMGIACVGASGVTAQSTPVNNKALMAAAARMIAGYNSLAQEKSTRSTATTPTALSIGGRERIQAKKCFEVRCSRIPID